jgi:predicted naringenin-chalcone synthase
MQLFHLVKESIFSAIFFTTFHQQRYPEFQRWFQANDIINKRIHAQPIEQYNQFSREATHRFRTSNNAKSNPEIKGRNSIFLNMTLFYLKNGFNKNEHFFQLYLWRYSVKTHGV